METVTYAPPTLSPEFVTAANLQSLKQVEIVQDGEKTYTTYEGKRITTQTFEEVENQVMNFGRHPLEEALFSMLAENRATIGSFTHAAKFRFNILDTQVKQALEDHFSCEIPAEQNRINYGTLVNERGGVVEDFMCYVDDEGFLNVVGNICNRDIWYDRFGHLFASQEAMDLTQRKAILYIYGTGSKRLIQELTGVDIEKLGWRGVQKADLRGIDIDVAVTTYTPFGGAEISFPIEALPHIWNSILTSGSDWGIEVRPCGLTGRDIARKLAGLPLGGLDYRIPGLDLEVPPQAIGAVIKAIPFHHKEATSRNDIRWRRVWIDQPDRRLRDSELAYFNQLFLLVSSTLFLPGPRRLERELIRYTTTKEEANRQADEIAQFLKSLDIKPGTHLFILGWGLNVGTRITAGNITGDVLPRRTWPKN